jgi:hypothetical protein
MAAAPLFGLNVHTMYHTADPVGVGSMPVGLDYSVWRG